MKPPEPAPPPPPRLLIVDDDPGLLKLLERTLRREGYETATAGDGATAIAALRRQPATLLLTDLKLPDMMGWEIIPAAAGDQPLNLPFVVMTGQGDERVAVEMMKRGAIDYVVKDADFLDRLPAVAGRALRQIEQDRRLAAAEAALKQEHAFVTAVLETAGALVVVLDRQGRIIRFNRACEQCTGFPAREMVGQPVWILFGRTAEQQGAQEIFHRLRNGQEFNSHENHWRTADGQERLITWSNTILRDAQGRVEYVIATGIDITERRHLEKEVLNIEERVQQRIGHDLHDDICQRLTGIEMMSQVLQQQLEAAAPAMADRAADIARLVRETIGHTRALARGLSPAVTEAEGLPAALHQLAESTRQIFGVDCRFDCPLPVRAPDLSAATHLYRIAQEAVSNALRHGEATRIRISLVKTPERLSLLVEDNGRGLPRQPNQRPGIGLRIMQYRAGVMGGTLVIQRPEPGGTVVVCTLHVPPETPSDS